MLPPRRYTVNRIFGGRFTQLPRKGDSLLMNVGRHNGMNLPNSILGQPLSAIVDSASQIGSGIISRGQLKAVGCAPAVADAEHFVGRDILHRAAANEAVTLNGAC